MIANNLVAAQEMIEQQLAFPIGQKWYVNEQHHHVRQFFTKWSHVQSLGVRAVTDIALNVALNHSTDPAVMTAVAISGTTEDEVHFYIQGEDTEVFPDSMTIDSGFLTATFPRARLVKEAFQDNPQTGWPYDQTGSDGPFAQALDIRRVYTDNTDVGEFVWPLGKACCPTCGEDTEPACGYIRSAESGIITLLPASGSNCIYCGSSIIRLNYCAGLPIDSVSEDAIMRLAHSLMATMPCDGCDPVMMLWKTDRNIPSQITEDRANGMFGVSDGAWRAWVYAVNNRHFRMPLI